MLSIHEITEIQLLKNAYISVLQDINQEAFVQLHEDENNAYSGVFLPVPFDTYYTASPKIMLVGRETAHWNTKNKKNGMNRLIDTVNAKAADTSGRVTLNQIIDEALKRYQEHFKLSGKAKGDGKYFAGRSRFKQYYFKVAKNLGLEPDALIYANLFAWDYNGRSPRRRPKEELDEITRLSCMLLNTQISILKPDFIIFATGFAGIDGVIKDLINDHVLGHYEKIEPFVSHRIWTFKLGDIICFRIAHPRATGKDYEKYRKMVIEEIKKSL